MDLFITNGLYSDNTELGFLGCGIPLFLEFIKFGMIFLIHFGETIKLIFS